MKPNLAIRILALLTASVLWSATYNGQAQTVRQGKAVVRAIRVGTAKYKDPASGVNEWKPLLANTVLNVGAMIETDSTGIANLFLGVNGPTVGLCGGSHLIITTLTITHNGEDRVTHTQLELKAGTLFGRVRSQSPASKYEIQIPNGSYRCFDAATEYLIKASGELNITGTGPVSVRYQNPNMATPIHCIVQGMHTFIPPSLTTPYQVTTTPYKVLSKILKLSDHMHPPTPPMPDPHYFDRPNADWRLPSEHNPFSSFGPFPINTINPKSATSFPLFATDDTTNAVTPIVPAP